jgi:hypothetical protein
MSGGRDNIGREHLPIPDRPFAGLVTYDAKDPATSFPPIEPLRPPSDAANVLIVLIDDAGFGASSAFGGPCATPTAERLGANGLKYNRFHITALCSPTRQALLTGRNHHSVGMGGITENSVVAMKNKSHAITAQIDVPEGGANGVIVAQGGAFGGFVLYAKDGRPAYCYNLFGLQRFKV